MVRDGAMHGEALVETKREGHGSLAGRRIVGGMRIKVQGSQVGEEGDSVFAISPSIRYVWAAAGFKDTELGV